jgi:hypothetical protein
MGYSHDAQCVICRGLDQDYQGREICVGSNETAISIANLCLRRTCPARAHVFLHVDWSFKAPVRPGETITGAVEILDVRDDKPITKLRTTVTREDGVVALEGHRHLLHRPHLIAGLYPAFRSPHLGVIERNADAVTALVSTARLGRAA